MSTMTAWARMGVFSSLVLTLSAAEVRSDRLQRTFAATPGGRILIETDRGSVAVEGREGQEVSVEVLRKVTRGSDDEAVALLERHQVRFSERDGVIRVEAELEGGRRWTRRGPQLEVEFRVAVPREFNVQAETAGGSVRVAHVAGEVSIRTSGGSLGLESVAGTIQGRTAGGSIRAREVSGRVDLSTSGGSIEVQGATGERLKVSTAGGSIRLEGIAVPVEARTSGGGIDVETSSSPLDASTSGGSVAVRFTEAPKDSVTLKTSAGGITVTLPAESAFQLDASTSAGSVRSEFPVAVTTAEDRERSHLSGPVQGGGPLVKLRTSAGSIRLRKG